MIHKTFISTFEECVQQCNPSVEVMLHGEVYGFLWQDRARNESG
jgi:hypothetical protein